MNDQEAATKWLDRAKADLNAAHSLDDYSNVCYHSQQAAEKALKAVLNLEGIDIPRHHDLDALRNLLPDTWPVKQTHPDLAQLSEWSTTARYPGNWPEPTAADAKLAVSQAQEVYDSIAGEFDNRKTSEEESDADTNP